MTKKILLSALALLGVVSCVKDQFDESLGDRVTITLTAENPGFASDAVPTAKSQANDSTTALATTLAPVLLDSTATFEESIAALGDRVVYSDSTMFICQPMGMAPDTKTGLSTEGKFFWEPGDEIGLITKMQSNWDNSRFINIEGEKQLQNTTFTGSIPKHGSAKVGYAFAYYPYNTSFENPSKIPLVSINLKIPDLQKPLHAGSFDGKADIMMAQVDPAPEGSYDGAQLKFRRKVGFMKFSLFDKAHKPLNKPINSITITSTSNIVGAVKLMLHADHEADIITSDENKVQVQYPKGQGSREIFAAVCPQDLGGVSLTIEGTTTDGKFGPTTKEIPAGNGIAENMYTFFGIVVETGGEVTPPDPDPTPGVDIPNDNAWLNFTKSNEAMATALQNNDMAEYNRILSERILLDFSYAGYMHGTAVPPTKAQTSWTEYNIQDYYYTTNARYDSSDRHAFLRALKAAGMITYTDGDNVGKSRPKPTANAIFYFPQKFDSNGKTISYVLHDSSDDSTDPAPYIIPKNKNSTGYNMSNNKKSNPIIITAGNFIIAGDGPGKTILEMRNRNNPTSKAFFSTKEMILIKNPDTDIEDEQGNVVASPLASVTSNVVRGSFSVQLGSDPNVKKDDWVILCLENTQPSSNLLNYELGNHSVVSGLMDNIQTSVSVRDYHQVKSWDSATMTLTFYEPIMRDVDLTRDGNNWAIYKYNNYTNVGVENLTFLGHAPEQFLHHGGHDHMHDPWLMDGGYKPLTMTGLVNSWVRNVQFVSISECLRFKMCANSSAYNIEIKGNRGHAGVSSAGSSRMFIGNINDHSDGYRLVQQEVDNQNPDSEPGAGQYHASGVSKPSMGAVLWKNEWGYDATFESHSGQPRATLVDNCKGGWVESRFGGDRQEIPNHLNDLTIWNMTATSYRCPNYGKNPFKWWTSDPKVLWRVSPPIVVGFSGEGEGADAAMDTRSGQMKYYENPKSADSPKSLYKAQLDERAKREPNATLQDWRTVLDGLQLPKWQYPTTN